MSCPIDADHEVLATSDNDRFCCIDCGFWIERNGRLGALNIKIVWLYSTLRMLFRSFFPYLKIMEA